MPRKLFGIALTAVLAVSLVACSSSTKSTSSKGPTAESADFGTMKNVCHSATGTNKPKSDIGVTANTVQLTTISDAGGTLQPGLNQELWDASQVFTDWCNAHGGVNGRMIQMLKGDAQLTQYDAVVKAACASSLALVGGGGVFDDLGQQSRVDCGMPVFPGFASSYAALGSSLVYQAVPTSNAQLDVGPIHYLTKTFPAATQKVGFIYGGFPSIQRINDQVRLVTISLPKPWKQGNLPGTTQPFNIKYSAAGLPSWIPVATQIRDAGLMGIIFNGQPADMAKLVVALNVVGATTLKFIYSSANMYDKTLITGGGASLNKYPVYFEVHSVPFEVLDTPKPAAMPTPTPVQKAAVSEFSALFAKYVPNGKSRTLLGAQSFAAWLLFTQAASNCGDNLTRKCLETEAKKLKNFDAGGLIVPNPQPGSNKIVPTCFTGIKATGAGFVILPSTSNPKGVFSCPPNLGMDTPLINQPVVGETAKPYGVDPVIK